MPSGNSDLRLDGQRVLLVYGLMGELVAAFQPFGLEYMHPLADWLRAQGAVPSVVKLRTAESVSANAARLRTELLADPAPALVIAHSKGGLEALAALLDPAAQAHCVGFLAMQSPFYGSPIADVVIGAKPLEAAAGGLARMLRIGSEEGGARPHHLGPAGLDDGGRGADRPADRRAAGVLRGDCAAGWPGAGA